jgi:CRP/FNR family transcriptional regulator, cyclic AMP receptor protein
MNAVLTSLIRGHLLHVDGVRKLAPARRFASLVTSETAPECLFFLDSGYVKIIRRGSDSKEALLSIVGPGEVFGEHAMLHRTPRAFTAEMLQEGTIYEIPKGLFLTFCESHPEMWQLLWELAMRRYLESEQKVALLCLEDVEFRILYYLGQLSQQFGPPASEHEEYSLPLSQSELATLIGATRETTSTTLNTLARQGLLKLGRRLVTVRSMDALRSASRNHRAKAARSGAS